jgi:hypothetical protein
MKSANSGRVVALLMIFAAAHLVDAGRAHARSLSKKQIETAIDFVIPKAMGKKLNAIQWTMKAGSEGRQVLSGNHYQLVNMAINRGLKRQKRARAANMGFMKRSSKKFNMLVKRKAGDGQVRYGDVIALNMKPYGWLRYKKQGRWGGINLSDDNNKPHYIWQIGGGKRGTKLVSGMPFAIRNLRMKTEIIYCKRSSGIDLGWRGRSKCGGSLARVSGKVFGANGALSGDGLSGKLANKWKKRLCKAGVSAAAAYVTAQTGGTTGAVVVAATPTAIKKCNKI